MFNNERTNLLSKIIIERNKIERLYKLERLNTIHLVLVAIALNLIVIGICIIIKNNIASGIVLILIGLIPGAYSMYELLKKPNVPIEIL